ncbi:MAG: LD-carboxypeptidase, partial [Cyanobacteria bacterium]|nr:LD-carboxypeptidase [Cyanobacteriota bacterium]
RVVARAVRVIEEMGFKARVGKHAFALHGYMAGRDEERLEDFNEFVRDESVRAILSLTGGFGSIRLVRSVDYEALEKDPKILLGSDDACCLLLAIHNKIGLVVFHGVNLDRVNSKESFENLRHALTICRAPHAITCGDFPEQFVYSPYGGIVEGKTIGGNLTALVSLLGTPYEIDLTDRILFIEEINERFDIIDRWFTSLYLSGSLARAKGCMVGRLENCSSRGMRSMISVEELVGERFQQLSLPSCFGMPIGQAGSSPIVPIGVQARFNADQGRLEFDEAPLVCG